MQKRKKRKWFAGALSLLMLAMAATGVLATEAQSTDTPSEVGDAVPPPRFFRLHGTVAETMGLAQEPGEAPQEDAYVMVETAGGPVKLWVTADTFVADLSNKEAEEAEESMPGIVTDMEILAFFDTTLPAAMIYPPQYAALAVLSGLPEECSATVDVFDAELVSDNGLLKLRPADTTRIITPDGTAYQGELAGRILLVLYTATTRSIPAQTTPEKLIVLN